MSGSPYASALEKLQRLAAFADRQPEVTAETLFVENVTGETLAALSWFAGSDGAQVPPWPRVVELLGANLVEPRFYEGERTVELCISQRGGEKFAEGHVEALDHEFLTAREASEVLSMLEHYRKRGERESTDEDD